MREEIGSAQNQSEIAIAKRFDKTPNNLLLSSQQTDLDVSGNVVRWCKLLSCIISADINQHHHKPEQFL